MKINQLPASYKHKSQTRNGNVYRFTTPKYVVDIVLASSNNFNVSFYYVTVSNKQGQVVWTGGKSEFLDSLDYNEFISDRFDRLILTRVNDTNRSDSMQYILVDLKTGEEKNLVIEGRYGSCGHFISFDGVFFHVFNDVQNELNCIDFETGKTFLLFEILKKHFPEYKSWGICPIDNCILVITNEKVNNVALFDCRKQEIKSVATLQWEEADNVTIRTVSVHSSQSTILSVSYSNLASNGYLKHLKETFFEVEF